MAHLLDPAQDDVNEKDVGFELTSKRKHVEMEQEDRSQEN